MLAVKNLERLIEIEADLKAQYEVKLNDKTAETDKAIEAQEELKAKLAKQQETLAKQQQQINELTTANSDTSRIEQLNRELESRAGKLQDEVGTQKKRIKTLQKDLAAERDELKVLKQFDVQKMKKNLDANKKKLAEKTSANELLLKSQNKFKQENAELKSKVEELEKKLAELEPEASTEETEQQAEATA